MERLRERDLERTLQFLADVATIDEDEPFPRAFLVALRGLVDCDWLGYSELDRVRQVNVWGIEYPDWDGALPDCSYWDIRHDHPVCRYHERTGDFSARKISGLPQWPATSAQPHLPGVAPAGRSRAHDVRRARRAARAHEGLSLRDDSAAAISASATASFSTCSAPTSPSATALANLVDGSATRSPASSNRMRPWCWSTARI